MKLPLLLPFALLVSAALPIAAMAQTSGPMASAPLPPPLPKAAPAAKTPVAKASAAKAAPARVAGKPVMPVSGAVAGKAPSPLHAAVTPPARKPRAPTQMHVAHYPDSPSDGAYRRMHDYAARTPTILRDPDEPTDVDHVPDADVEIRRPAIASAMPAPPPYPYYEATPPAYRSYPPNYGYGYGYPRGPGFYR